MIIARRQALIGALTSLWLAAGLVMTHSVFAAESTDKPVVPETPAQKQLRLKWWREARFGMFIHWGPVSQKGTEISWSRGAIPIEEYDSLYKTFNPTKFSADQWAATAKAAGMKYMVFTAKHHDGFCEWFTRTTDYNISKSPYNRDICAELAKAARKAGLKVGWYYSPGDWHDPDCRTERNAAYVKRMQEQIRELLTNYGPIDMLWIDYDGRSSPWDQANTYKLIKTLQPKIIIDNRLDMGSGADYGAQKVSPNADYYTPEQYVGGYDDIVPWETCMTIANQWAWRPNDPTKSLQECLQILIKCAGGDGNLLFNVGPMPTGEIEPLQVQRLKDMGAWLKKYGESIYGTRGGPFKPNGTIASTRKGDVIYVHVLKQSIGSLSLPPIPAKIKSATLLTGGKLTFTENAGGISIEIPKDYRQEIDTIIKLKLDASAMDIPAVSVAKTPVKLSGGMGVVASNIYQDSAGLGPEMAFDNDPNTRWATDAGVKQAWLTVEYEKPTRVSRIVMSEEYDRVKVFEVQCQDGANWKTFYKGTTIGKDFKADFDPVTAKVFRLNILEATDGPTFWEIALR